MITLPTFGIGIRRRKKGLTLDVWFPMYYSGSEALATALTALLSSISQNGFVTLTHEQLQTLEQAAADASEKARLNGYITAAKSPQRYAETDIIAFVLRDGSQPIESAEEAYFKLQLISQRRALPHGVCLDGAFGKLTNVAWTNYGPLLPEDLDQERLAHYSDALPLMVSHVDKFPYLVNYHVPTGVRIASGAQVRLGAHLGEGTTVMQAGFVNFNAGSKGTAMIEGRVSAGVVLGDNTDIGGGASIMGTLSGGGKEVISLGCQCLLGANAGTGISLGDQCTVASGIYITAGAKISCYNENGAPVNLAGEVVAEGQNVVKGRDLNGRDRLLFLQDSQTGKLICKPNPKAIALNAALHKN